MQSVLMAFAFAVLCFMFYSTFRTAQAGRITSARIFIVSLVALLLTPLAFGAFLYVVSARVPGPEKDGMFGAAGGLIMGVFILNATLAAANIGTYWRKRGSSKSSAGET
jgi:hypothetical protein